MKYVIVLGDGMADRPIAELGNKTPLEYAKTPVMDSLAKRGELGLVHTIPEGMKPGSDTANLSVLGYDPKKYYSGRSPLEALSIGVPMKDTDVALRCNIVTLSEEEDAYEKRHMIDHSSDEISTEDAAVLLRAVVEGLGLSWCEGETTNGVQSTDGTKNAEDPKSIESADEQEFSYYVGTSYRHCLIWNHGEVIELAQPHDILEQCIEAYLPTEPKLLEMMKKSYDILVNHPINIERKKKGLRPANSCWFWGAGTRPALSSFEEKTGKKGAMISAVDLLKGIAVGASMKVIEVDGANGGLHTNYEGKAQAAINVLTKENYDFVYVHLEGPDEMGHQGSVERKVQAIEWLDERIVKPIVDGLHVASEDFRMLILPDHPTPICIRTHSSEPVPYVLYDSRCAGSQETDASGKLRFSDDAHNGKQDSAREILGYCEKEAEKTGVYVAEGHTMIDRLLES
ncbi:MAG: cofactor-independent phosphoglycerate mutase [Agathobacter sp.]|nr:cofactor-independent phosphoglycerate mutase [Agathobacter sp.]